MLMTTRAQSEAMWELSCRVVDATTGAERFEAFFRWLQHLATQRAERAWLAIPPDATTAGIDAHLERNCIQLMHRAYRMRPDLGFADPVFEDDIVNAVVLPYTSRLKELMEASAFAAMFERWSKACRAELPIEAHWG